MAAGIKIEIRKVRGPWADIVVEPREEGNIVRIIPTHFTPRLSVATHAPKPKMLAGMWELPPYTKEAASRIELIAIQPKMLSQNLQGINSSNGGRGFKAVIYKTRIGFFEIKGVAIMGNGNIARTEEIVEFFDQGAVIREAFLIRGIVRESLDGDTSLVRPAVGK